MQPTFKDVYTAGLVQTTNELYTHIHQPDMLIRYDSNYVQFNQNPSLEEFLAVDNYLREFHQKTGQEHLRYHLPENSTPTKELTDFLTKNNYDSGLLELYSISPNEFRSPKEANTIIVESVTKSRLDDLLDIRHAHDLIYGEEFANLKKKLNQKQFNDPKFNQIIARKDNDILGYLDVIVSNSLVEIDNFMVKENCRKQGVGSLLQQLVMDTYQNHKVILVADGDDTPRLMYQKQNYKKEAAQFEIQKIL